MTIPRVLFLVPFFILHTSCFILAQNISGVINAYVPVIAIDTCLNTVTVPTAVGFGVGDRVLIIQMKGAQIDTTNTSNYGKILSMNGAGQLEIATIQSRPDLITIRFRDKLLNAYDAKDGFVQLVSIPQFVNVTVTDTLRAQPWYTQTGGVLILEVSGTLTLDAPIDISGCGFWGGLASFGDGGGDSIVDYTFIGNSGSTINDGGYKGDGIGNVGIIAGRGAPANGGGGGNAFNTGGGGGGNGGVGGRGGDQCNAPEKGRFANGGESGKQVALVTPTNLFLGGGGGGGHQNDLTGSDGGRGGGVAIIRAKNIVGSHARIIANGSIPEFTAYSDGAGGGGGAGTIMLDAQSAVAGMHLEAKGGDGGESEGRPGDWAQSGPWGYGPGGGGGGGAIYYSRAVAIALSENVSGGNAGMLTNCSDVSINNSTYGAADGEKGISVPLDTIIFSESAELYNYPSTKDHSLQRCPGDSVVLTAFGGGTYLWSPSIGMSDPTLPQETVSPESTTVYSVQITKGNCIFTDTVHVEVQSKLLVTILGETTLCEGDTTTLATSSPFDMYLWHPNGETTSSIKVWASGSYSVDVTKAGDCPASSKSFQVTVNPLPPTPIISRNGSMLSSTSAASYAWNINGSPIPGANSQTIVATHDGSYTVTITDANGCASTSDPFAFLGEGSAHMSVPALSSGAPGDLVWIPLMLDSASNIIESGATTFLAYLRIDASMLTPVNPPGTLIGKNWIIPLTGPAPNATGVLATLTFRANDTGYCSPIVIDTFYFPTAKIAVTKEDGTFCLTGSCRPWVTSSDTAFVIKRITPNPSSGEFAIDYRLASDGLLRIELEDLMGRIAKTLERSSAKAGDYHETFVTSDLPSGGYRLILHSGSRTVSATVEVVK